jgi:predicted alpha/beta superfamily hydrolase
MVINRFTSGFILFFGAMKLMCRFVTLIVCLITGSWAFSQNKSSRIEHRLAGNFKLSIYTPPGYDENKTYKVLYFNDGQTVFGPYGLNADSSANELIQKNLIEPLIIVGIHSDQDRTSNYVPYNDESAKRDFGDYSPDADSYSKRIIKQVIPFIEKKYKTKPGNGIAGYSFGGLHATWAALNFPDQFAFSGALSPSYWVKEFEIFKDAGKAQASQLYYFDIGTGEWNYVVPFLIHSNLTILKNIFYYEDHGARHHIANWRGNRTRNILLLFAGKTDLSQYTWENKLEIIRSASTGKFYMRINPLITYSNGLNASISYAATFTISNPAAGEINKDGSFRFIYPQDLNVIVNYNGEEKTMVIKFAEVEKIKATL